MKSVLIVALIGLPGSGKSRLCFQLLSEAEKSKEIGVFIVDFDKIIGRNLRLDEGEKIWKSRRRKILLGLRKLLNGLWASHQEEEVNGEEEAEEAILEGLLDWRKSIKDDPETLLILLDDNMFYRSMRREVFNLIKSILGEERNPKSPPIEMAFLQLYLHCPVPLAIERNTKRPLETQVNSEVISKMAGLLEEPFDAGGDAVENWESSTIIIDLMKTAREEEDEEAPRISINDLLSMREAAGKVVKDSVGRERQLEARQAEAEKQLLTTRDNWNHQIDLALRRAITDAMREGKRDGQLAQRLNKERKRILEELKADGLERYRDLGEAVEALVCELLASGDQAKD